GPVSNRQDGSYAHDVVVSPDGAYVFVCDLGADVIRVIRPASSACKDAAHVADIPLRAGSGPRHLKFFVDAAKGKTFAYLSSEFANTITSFLYAPTASSDEVLQQIGEPSFSSPPALPLGGNKADGPKRTLAEVQVAPNGRFVFASNRGDSQEDSISVLTRGDNGRASWTYWYRSGGLNPRHFDVSPDGQYLSVANQDSGNVVVLRVSDKDGSLDKVATLGGLPKVAFAGFAPADK
ncbi:putative isomerase YbhE, partial [Tilletiopsis washingtonensis]